MDTSRLISMVRQDGFFSTLWRAMRYISVKIERRFAYMYRQHIRENLPKIGRRTFNGVYVFGEKRLFDEHLPYRYHYPNAPGKGVVRPNYENGIVAAHNRYTKEGDSVIIIGGGIGVTAARAAQIVGSNGFVRVYEGGKESVEDVRRVLELNDVDGWCEVSQQVIGQPHNVYGGDFDASRVQHPSELPDCDVLELDCEGAELEIIQKLKIRPRAILVELHPWAWGQEPEAIVDELISKGYDIPYELDHDGALLDDDQFRRLLLDSKKQEHKRANSDLDWPVVIAAIRDD